MQGGDVWGDGKPEERPGQPDQPPAPGDHQAQTGEPYSIVN